jgi:hypothetical protein
VTLPAVTCDSCGYDFKLGRKPAPETPPASRASLDDEAGGRRKLMIIGAAVAAAIVLILVLALRGGPDLPEPEAAPAPGGQGSSVLAPSPSVLDSPIMNPQRPIGTARRVAGEVDQNHDQLEETYQETAQDPQ